MLHRVTEKIAKLSGENSDYGVPLGRSNTVLKAQEFLKYERLSDLLHYESYDEEEKVFLNQKSVGFILEVGLYLGSEGTLESELSALFKNILPVGSNIQFLFSASDKVEDILDYWRENRVDEEIIGDLSDERIKFFKELSYSSNSTFRIRDFRGIISVSIECDLTAHTFGIINELKSQVKSVFATRGQCVKEWNASDLINFLSDILNVNRTLKVSNKEWNKYDSISSQIIDRSTLYDLGEDFIRINGHEKEIRFLSVDRYPESWEFSKMSALIGDRLNDYLKIPCLFLIAFGVHIEGSKFQKTKMLAKASRVEGQANTPLGKWIPALRREAEEWGFVRNQLEKSERLVKTHYQVILIDNPETILASEQIVSSLYRANGWELVRDKFIVMSSLISMLPLSWGSGMYHDMSYLKKIKTTLSHEPINLLPLQGEFKGTKTPGMLLAGRRGQLFYWYPFDEGMGNSNYNVSVVGRSGSGKSVFMQELATSILSQKGRVYVLDVGRSFEKQVKLFGGQFLEFSTKSDLCLNPFSNIDDSDHEKVQDSLSVLKPIVAMMAAPKAGTTDYEDALITKCLTEVWARYGKEAGLSDIAEWFLEEGSKNCKMLGSMLFPYTKEGPYGKFFNGKSNIDFNSNFFVTELEELKSRPELQSVVVQILMLLITNNVILGGRKFNSGLIFDEAWDLLKGKQGGEFIERLARTLRKYKGALVVGTQNLDDFYSSTGAEAAFMNSDWLCMLSQKKESIARLLKTDKFKIDVYTQKILESVKTVSGEYAEIMIMSPNGGSIARLLLDPFSRVLYSTKPEEYARVKELEGLGSTLKEAIKQVSAERYFL